jgi:hypothetical protein
MGSRVRHNGRDAPIPAIRQTAHERLQSEPQTRYSISSCGASRNAFLCSVLHALEPTVLRSQTCSSWSLL